MRLIDADALLAEYDRVHVGPPGGARKLMEDAPTIELLAQPEIIHCKDCMFKETHGVSLCCDHITGVEIMVMPSDHCSWAEKRQDEGIEHI